jgi:flagellar M-ring protein FliF
VTLEQILDKLKSLRGSMSTTQLISLGVSFVGVMGAVIAFAFWLNQPTYRLLFSDMDAESAAAVTERLRGQDVQYRLTDGGRSIQVPADQIDELRLTFAGAGLPQSGRLGFELFDRTQFGATEFLEGVTYRRALEGEIARTIATIAEVSSARVHIAMAKDSLFQSKEQPAKASVVLRLKSRTPLSASTVAGIRSLVAFAVEGLRPELVAILDTQGRPLTNDDTDDEPLGAQQVDRQQRYERDLAARVVTLLEPVVGPDRVRVNVAARLNIDSEDKIEETWDPNVAIRSHVVQTSASGGAELQQGVAGARGNLPAPVAPGTNTPAAPTLAAPATAGTSGGTQTLQETINNEVSRVTRHTVRPRGDVARLSVAVILDDDEVVTKQQDGTVSRERKPRDPAELQKINGLVAAAVGLDTQRGDQLTVENIAFDQPFDEVPVATPTTMLQRVPMWGWVAGGVGVVVLLGGLTFLLMKRGKRAKVKQGEVTEGALAATEMLPPQQQLPKTIEEIEGEIAQQLDIEAQNNGSDRRVPVMAKRLTGVVAKDPEAAARLVRSWLVDEKKAS